VIVGIMWQKPVLTHASIVFGGMLASVNSVNWLVVLVWLVFRHRVNELIIKSASRPCARFTKRLYTRLAVCDTWPPCAAGRVYSCTENHAYGNQPATGKMLMCGSADFGTGLGKNYGFRLTLGFV